MAFDGPESEHMNREQRKKGWARRLAVILAGGLAAGCAAGGTRMTDQGLMILPAAIGDLTEVSIERSLRNSTGIWMGMKRGLAIEEFFERADAEYSSTPTSGGITSLRLGKGVYFSLYSYHLPNDISTILVCGYSVWTTTGSLPPVIPASKVRAALEGDARTVRKPGALYRKTRLRAISLYYGEDDAFFFVDMTTCPARDPGPPEEDT
jgi:hypothetical protein